MRLAVFLVTMLTLVSFTGCLDGLTSEDIQEVKPGCTYAEAENYDPMAQIDDGYEIRTDKMDSAGEMCPRQNETSGEDLYVIEFFDVWADAYVSEPNQALPGFSAIFALFSLLGISLFRRRK